MMVETVLESSQDFGMSGGALPQWKRELLQRRAARVRPPAPPPAPPPPPPAAPPAAPEEDEELRYGPGIVKRLKSRYLSLALRDAPRRRPSVLRRAASLEHLLEERPPPAPPRPAARAPRPVSLAAPSHAQARREFVKRARSVDALSRLEAREEPPSSPPPPCPAPSVPAPAPPSLAPPASPPPPPPPAPPRSSTRPPRRPTPLLRETERPPPDVVRSTLRKFEPAPIRRAAPAARVSAALRGLERGTTPTPEPRSPSPASPATPAPDEPGATSTPRPVSRAALEGIARAGSTTRYSFEAPKRASHLPPLAATNPVMLGRARRVGVIRPMPAPALERAISAPTPPAEEIDEKLVEESPRITDAAPRIVDECPRAERTSPVVGAPHLEPLSPPAEKRDPPPSALVEPIPRSPPPPLPRSPPPPAPAQQDATPEPVAIRKETKPQLSPKLNVKKITNGYAEPPRVNDVKPKEVSRVNGADVECAWNGVTLKKISAAEPRGQEPAAAGGVAGAAAARRVAARGGRGAPPPPSVVFNFSHRKEVPDYIENDGIILRASRRERIKAGEPGVVVLRPELLAAREGGGGGEGSDSESEVDAGPPSPCAVRFVNDNVLINGRSSMPAARARDRDRANRLKLQFDDSLTRTFEYPSETSLCEEDELDVSASPCPAPRAGSPPAPRAASPPAPPAAPAAHTALTANTHLVSGALGRYTPSKTCADAFQLGVTRHAPPAPPPAATATAATQENGTCAHESTCGTEQGGAGCGVGEEGECEGDARPCGADAARSWSEARTLHTDLLF